MGSIDSNVDAKEETKEKISDKIKNNHRQKSKEKDADEEEEILDIKTDLKKSRSDFVPPPLSLLEGDRGKPSSGDIKANANIIKRTLQNFGIDVEMGEINIGPSVTHYTSSRRRA